MSVEQRKDDKYEHKLAIYKELDKAVREGPWEKSAILRALGKIFRELHFRFKEDLGIGSNNNPVVEDHIANRIAQRKGQIEVFISLYNTDGDDLKKWQKQIATISQSMVTRPVYSSERDIRALIRSKVNKKNEGYVAAYIDASDIILSRQEQRSLKDKFDHQLLLIKDKAISAKNITRFIHVSGEYLYKDEKLIRSGDIQYTEFI